MVAARRRYWLFKSEPSVFSWDDLWKSPGRRTFWDGVRNFQARNLLRDEIRVGDGVLFYHSNAKPMAIVGVAKVVKAGYPDHTAFDPGDPHYDEKSDPDDPTRRDPAFPECPPDHRRRRSGRCRLRRRGP